MELLLLLLLLAGNEWPNVHVQQASQQQLPQWADSQLLYHYALAAHLDVV
jgi:hypothetical protein